jgi:hypothetical protein
MMRLISSPLRGSQRGLDRLRAERKLGRACALCCWLGAIQIDDVGGNESYFGILLDIDDLDFCILPLPLANVQDRQSAADALKTFVDFDVPWRKKSQLSNVFA